MCVCVYLCVCVCVGHRRARACMATPCAHAWDRQTALKVADFAAAADVARVGLRANASDPALTAMFRASIGKLSECVRCPSFLAFGFLNALVIIGMQQPGWGGGGA